MVCEMSEEVTACIVVGESVVDELVDGAWGCAAGDIFLRSMVAVIDATDNAIDATVDDGVNAVISADVGTLTNLYCKEFDCCSAEVVQMSFLPNSTASFVTNASQQFGC